MGDDPVSDEEIIDARGGVVVGVDGTFSFTGNAKDENLNEDWGEG